MSLISEKVAYLRGMAESIKAEDSEQLKLMRAIIDALAYIAEELEDINDSQDELFDHIFDIEDALDLELDDDDDDDDDLDLLNGFSGEYVVECPNCKEEIYLNESVLQKATEIKCEKCGAEILLELSDDDVCDCDECIADQADDDDLPD